MRYRTGRKVGNTIYRQVLEEPSDSDVFIGSTIHPVEAAQLVAYANGYVRLREELAQLSDALTPHGSELDGETVVEAAIRVLRG